MKLPKLIERFFDRMRNHYDPPRSSKRGERLTEWEENEMQENRCPDCGASMWIEGPHGGGSVNTLCANCLSDFNIGVFPERISDARECDLERAYRVYGVARERYLEQQTKRALSA